MYVVHMVAIGGGWGALLYACVGLRGLRVKNTIVTMKWNFLVGTCAVARFFFTGGTLFILIGDLV